MRSSKIGLAGAAAAALIVLAGCGASGGNDGNSASASGSSTSSQSSQSSSSQSGSSASSKSGKSSENASKKASMTIKNFKYQTPKSVAPGAKVTVKNMDSTTHTVTVDKGGSFDVSIPGGASATFTAPTKPGKYPFHCKYHSDMHGTLVVTK